MTMGVGEAPQSLETSAGGEPVESELEVAPEIKGKSTVWFLLSGISEKVCKMSREK